MDRNEEVDVRAKMTVENFSRLCLCKSDEELFYAMKCILAASAEGLASIQGWEQAADMLEKIRLMIIENKDDYVCEIIRPETEH